jgi:enoyl-CoA hydratase/carnithine racemase
MMNYTPKQVQDLHQETFAYLKVREADHILTITLNRPAKRNAMNTKMMEEIAFALAYARFTADVWVVVFEAEGKIFSAGADLKAMASQHEEDSGSSIPAANGEVLLGELMIRVHKPTIVKMDAPVLAGGHMIVGGALYVVATENATFSLPEVKRGLFPFQVMETLMQTLPRRRVLDWCLRGRTLSAHEAAEVGLVTHWAQDAAEVDRIADQLIQELRQGAPTAIRMGLQAFDELRALTPADAHAYLKDQLNAIRDTDDAQEGIAAFREKRQPQWYGQ